MMITIRFMILFKISVPLNKYRGTVLVCNMIAFVLCAVVLNELFAIKSMSRICVLLFVVFSFAAESLFRILSRIVENVENHFEKTA